MSKSLFDQPNRNDSIRRYLVTLAWLLSSAKVVKGAGTASEVVVEIPVTISGNQAYYKSQRITDDNQVAKFKQTVPRAAIRFDGLQIDVERKQNRHADLISQRRDSGAKSQKQRSPYSFNFTYTIRVKSRTDAYQLIELIATTFDPYIAVRLRDNRDVDIIQDVTFALMDIGYEDNWEGDFEEGQEILVPFQFQVNGFLYNVSEEPSIIHSIHHQLNIQPDGVMDDWIVVRDDQGATP